MQSFGQNQSIKYWYVQYLIPVYKCDVIVMFPTVHPNLQITLNYEDSVLGRLEKTLQ